MNAGTFANEAALPRVPVPSLGATRDRFLQWCAPLLSEEELLATTQAVDALVADPVTGQLQDALTAYEAGDGVHSWLDDFWRDRYLGRRDRIALNANFFFLFRPSAGDGGSPGQEARAARLIASALAYKKAVDAEQVPPTTRRGQPLSMQQHRFLFSTTRIPGAERDTVRAPYSAAGWPGPSDARHVLVLARGRMWRVDVLDERGEMLPGVAEALRAILAVPGRGQGVGALTSKARADWAASRGELLAADPRNAAALDSVETALLCVALEDPPSGGTADSCRRLLAGDPGSRWFDKALTFIVFPDGSAGLNGEHCMLDGTTTVEFLDAVLTAPAADLPPAGPAPAEEVAFALTDELVADVEAAAKDFTRYADDTAMMPASYPGFGSARAKQLGMSPDAFTQLAFQLAHYRAKGLTGATYESIATRHWHHGRTEAMRVVTPEVTAFVSAFTSPDVPREQRAAALRAAADAHVKRARECQEGDAPEQHLWELLLLARRRGLDWSPPFYSSPGWLISRDDYLSTSSCPSVNVDFFGFGATSGHCIGVAYLLLPDRFNVHLSTPRSATAAMEAFAEQLGAALVEMADVLGGARG